MFKKLRVYLPSRHKASWDHIVMMVLAAECDDIQKSNPFYTRK